MAHALLMALSLVLAAASTANAAGEVTNCATFGDPGTPGDLAWALVGGGTVTFACSGTIVVPEIVLDQDTAVDGTGQTVTLSGNGVNRVLSVSSGVTVELTGITVADGATGLDAVSGANGAGIYNGGSLTLTNSTVSDNSATFGDGGGIYTSSGALTLTNSTVSGNSAIMGDGGGIYNSSGTLTLTNSTVSGNSARSVFYSYFSMSGGGILNGSGGALTLTNSTVRGNFADYGGGIYNTSGSLTVINSTVSGNVARLNSAGNAGGYGGGVYNLNGTLTLTNSTVSGNHAVSSGGGIYGYSGSLTNSTVSDNSASYGVGAGIDGAFTLTNSIVAQQSQGGDCRGAVTSQGYNLDSDATCSLTAPGDVSGGIADLLPLAVNAPGATATHAPGPMSQARDAIPPGVNGCGTTITTDQRGVARPQGAGCEIGSHEWMLAQQMPQTITVTTVAPPSAAYGTVFPVAATASSGLPVAITAAGACEGTGSSAASIRMTSGTGTCTVHYNQAGNESYYPAPEVTSDTVAIADTVTIRQAIFVRISSTLFVSATSSVTSIPHPALYVTVQNCLNAVPMLRKADAGAYVLQRRVTGCGNLDGQPVTVTSSQGGVATATIR